MAAIVEQRVHRLLQHALLVTDDDLWGLQLHEVAQAIVAVDDAAVKIVEVAGGKATTLQRHQRAQVRWDDGQDGEDHPLRPRARLDEAIEKLDALG